MEPLSLPSRSDHLGMDGASKAPVERKAGDEGRRSTRRIRDGDAWDRDGIHVHRLSQAVGSPWSSSRPLRRSKALYRSVDSRRLGRFSATREGNGRGRLAFKARVDARRGLGSTAERVNRANEAGDGRSPNGLGRDGGRWNEHEAGGRVRHPVPFVLTFIL